MKNENGMIKLTIAVVAPPFDVIDLTVRSGIVLYCVDTMLVGGSEWKQRDQLLFDRQHDLQSPRT